MPYSCMSGYQLHGKCKIFSFAIIFEDIFWSPIAFERYPFYSGYDCGCVEIAFKFCIGIIHLVRTPNIQKT